MGPASGSSSRTGRRVATFLPAEHCGRRNGPSESLLDSTRCRMCWDCRSVARVGDPAAVIADRATRMRTGVALGSNLGDRLENLRAARKAILSLSNVKPPILSSAIYQTDPVDCEPGAEKFLNAV